MKVTVKLGAPLSHVVGESKLTLSLPEGATVADVLNELKVQHAEFEAGLKGKGLRGELPYTLYTLFLNARPVAWDRLESTAVRDADRLYIFLPVVGG